MMNFMFVHEEEVGDAIGEFMDNWDWFRIRTLLPNIILLVGKDRWLIKHNNDVYGVFTEKEVHKMLFYLRNIKSNIDFIRENIGDI
jgi:hypothetical protein